MVRKAIIPAAGYGTRSLPISKVLPKEMFPICGRPAIDFLIEEAIQSGIEQILIIVSRSKNMILDYFDRSIELEAHLEAVNKEHLLKELTLPNVHIQYVRQTYAGGLGQAVLLAKNFAENEPFAVMLPDEIILSEKNPPLLQLVEMHQKYDGNVIALKKMEQSELKNYGVIQPEIIVDKHYKILEIVEKPVDSPPSNLAVVGRYILDPLIFKFLEEGHPGVDGELQLTDAIQMMLNELPVYGMEIDGSRYDIAKQEDYINLINLVYKTRLPKP